jgi:hypothetical protein
MFNTLNDCSITVKTDSNRVAGRIAGLAVSSSFLGYTISMPRAALTDYELAVVIAYIEEL